jgi:hypothetical protein
VEIPLVYIYFHGCLSVPEAAHGEPAMFSRTTRRNRTAWHGQEAVPCPVTGESETVHFTFLCTRILQYSCMLYMCTNSRYVRLQCGTMRCRYLSFSRLNTGYVWIQIKEPVRKQVYIAYMSGSVFSTLKKNSSNLIALLFHYFST